MTDSNPRASASNVLHAPDWLINPAGKVAITVIGAGGTGGEVIDQLCRLDATLRALNHAGLHVRLFDGDVVSESNVGRQRFSMLEVGTNKAVALINRINLFYGLRWEGVPLDFDVNHDRPSDFTITATDSAAFRHAFADIGALQSSHLWLDFGNGSRHGQAVLGHYRPRQQSYFLRSEPERFYLPNVIDLFPDMVDDPNDGPSCSVAEAIRAQPFGINAALVSNAFVSLVWPLFRKGKISTHGVLMDTHKVSMTPLSIDPATWALLGYDPSVARGDTVPGRAVA